MKHIKVVLRPEKLNELREALKKAGCDQGIMITEIEGHGKQRGITHVWRGEKYQLDLIPKVMIDMIVADSDVPLLKKIIIENARTDEYGDGKIFIYNVEEVIRIRTGEEGEKAL